MDNRTFVKLLTASIALGWSASTLAAVTPNSPVTPQTPNRGAITFVHSTSTGTYFTVYTAGANGSKCVAGWIDSNDTTSTHRVDVQLVNTSATQLGGASVTITTTVGGFIQQNLFPQAPMALGANGSPWLGLPVDSDLNPYMFLIVGDTLQASIASAPTTATQVDVHFVCADF